MPLLSRRERLRKSLELSSIASIVRNDNPRPEMLAQVELLPAEVRAWDAALLLWTKARCAFLEKSWGSVSSLYVNHIEHAHQTGGMFAPDRETFIAILMALGFVIEDGMVYGLILAEDWKPENTRENRRH